MSNEYLIDTHCHLDASEFDLDREIVMVKCRQLGVCKVIIPAVLQAGWQGTLDLCAQYSNMLYPALGMHPIYLTQHRMEYVQALEIQLVNPAIIAVGEIGLDYLLPDLDRETQKQLFEAQLSVATNQHRPVLLHVRKAHDAMIQILRRFKPPKGGIVHAFNGSYEQAMQYIQLGFKLGFGGTMTYPHSRKIRELALRVPLEHIVLETDAPDMVVARHHGGRNSPEYLVDCLSALAEIRQLPTHEVMRVTTGNVLNLFPTLQGAG